MSSGLSDDAAFFPSKRDAWLSALIWGAVALCAWAAWVQLGCGTSLATRWLPAAGLLAVSAFMLWILYGTGYRLEEDVLRIRSGPFRFRVPLAEIDSVTPSRNPLSSPACSLDRLLIQWGNGRRRILVSPVRRAEFLETLARRCPELELHGESLVRASDR